MSDETCNQHQGISGQHGFSAPSIFLRALEPTWKRPLNDFACSRIRTERNGGAWCPKRQISKDVQEWIEVDLQEVKVITQVETQGRFGNGQVWSSFVFPVKIVVLFCYYIYIYIYTPCLKKTAQTFCV